MRIAELGTVANVSWGDTSVTKKSYVESGYQAYSATGPDGFLPDFDFEEPGLVLSAIGARCGKCFKANGRWKAIKNTITITASAGSKLDIDYLYYIANDEGFWPKRGMAQPFIGLGDARKVQIPLPPITEQKRIAGILDAADALRAKRRESLAQLDTLLQSTFLEMFGDPVTNPMGWDMVDFENVVFFQEGPGVRKWQFRDSGIKLINVKNIVSGELRLENTSRHLDPEEVNKKYSHFLLDEGNLVMSSSGVTWGKIAYVEEQHLPLCLNTSMIRLRPRGAGITHSFIRAFVESQSFRRQILRIITGSAQPNFGPSHLKKIAIGLPPIDLQHRFAAIVESVEQQKASQRAHLEELDTLFASLQSRAFNGDL